MRSRKLGRAATAASLMMLLVPGIASASWWDGDYDGRYDNGYSARSDYRPPEDRPPGYGPIYGCENSDLPDTGLLLHKMTVPPPGTPVRPGDEILVEITWQPYDFGGPELHKVIDCVYINGLLAPGLSGGERLTPNDGHFAWRYFVPLDVPPGSEICDQGFASGSDGWDEYGRRGVSDFICFPVVTPPPPPPPCCQAPPPPPCCEAPPPVETTTTTMAPTTTTTVPDEEPEPYALSERFDQEQEPPAQMVPIVQPQDVLPRTGSSPATARVAAGSLALLALILRRTRRG